jgi:hypothetical protein
VEVHGDRGFCAEFLTLMFRCHDTVEIVPVDRGYNTGALNLLRLCPDCAINVLTLLCS